MVNHTEVSCGFPVFVQVNVGWQHHTGHHRLLPTFAGYDYLSAPFALYKGVSKSFRTGHLERELQMGQLSATRCSFIVILWVSIVGFASKPFLLLLNECLLLFISVSTQSGNFWIRPRIRRVHFDSSWNLSSVSFALWSFKKPVRLEWLFYYAISVADI
jgi:hypothetical protein